MSQPRPHFPAQLEPPLEYARMYVELMGWVRAAPPDDPCASLAELAQEYMRFSVESASRERDRLAAALAPDVWEAMENGYHADPVRPLAEGEIEAVRAWSSTRSALQLEGLSFIDMHDLADMIEGWAHDPRLGSIGLTRLLGTADSFRSLAEVAG